MKTIILFATFFVLSAVDLFAQPNCSSPSTGFVPINDLGTGISPVTGLMGGLYPNGSNFLPTAHKTAGLLMASQVQCLDADGKPDAVNGKIVWLSIGMSNCTQESQQFIRQANAFARKNPKLTLVDGAQGGQTASNISTRSNPNYATFWNTVSTRLINAGVTGNQVQVIWFKEANSAGTTPIRNYYDSLVVQIKRIMNEIKTRFPNARLCYLASRISARYATSNLNPEPYSYWTGWAVKKVIGDQINGDPQLAYLGTQAKSPWLTWGIYMWSDGSTPQTSNPNVFFTCPTDYQNDGTHPSTVGAQKVGSLLLDFFSTDSTAKPWFLGTGCPTPGLNNVDTTIKAHIIYPNPNCGAFALKFKANVASEVTLTLVNPVGQVIETRRIGQPMINQEEGFDMSCQSKGVYVLMIATKSNTCEEKIIIE